MFSDKSVLVVAALSWGLTFVVADSDCTIQEFVRLECTELRFGARRSADVSTTPNMPEVLGQAQVSTAKGQVDVSASKGQFGDTFGVLNGLFGALTLWLVYRTFRRESESNSEQIRLAKEALDSERASSAAQIELVRIERYYSEIEAAKQAYNRLLQAVEIPDIPEGKRSWPAAHGLFHAWKFIATIVCQAESQTVTSQIARGTSQDIFLKVWRPVAAAYRWDHNASLYDAITPERYEREHFTSRWVQSQIESLDARITDKYLSALLDSWRDSYTSNVYQFDALFRAWYHVCKAIANASEFQIDSATEWRAAARWRAQLSWIELVYLLSNQCLSEGENGNGFPKAVVLSERYAMFDNFQPGIDPTAHFLNRLARGRLELAGARRLKDEAFSSDLARSRLTVDKVAD
jgi:hypothetical protein